jgi:hypothetical protein
MTRNSAVAISKSNCILPLDADDLLANSQALESMYNVWKQDKSKTVYGNLQVLQLSNDRWQTSKVVQLADYSFDGVMDLNGRMPVSVMHSKDAWFDAGGWKPEFAYGREDVEYWISAGKAGFCGKKLNYTTLLYRKHEQSRDYFLKHVSGKLDETLQDIIKLHNDVYNEGKCMGCGCGSGGNKQQQVNNRVGSSQIITTLDQYPENQKVWVEYKGTKLAAFSILSRTGKANYRIQGLGHKLQVHIDDLVIFKGLERGQAFSIGIPEPRPIEVEPQSQTQQSEKYNGGEPKLATLERMDTVSESVVETTPIEHQPLTDIDNHPLPNGKSSYTDVAVLGLSDNISEMLSLENWTVEKLAEANISELTAYRGIGDTRATQIVESAKQWLEQRQ